MNATAAYMVRMERLYMVNLAVVADDGNDGGGGWGGKAGAPGGNGIARINCQAVAAAAAVEEEEEEGRWTAMATAWLTATGGQLRMATPKMATRAPHPAPGG
jgi:hypothetical protein